MNEKNCLVCNKNFFKLPSHSKKYWAIKRFCSQSCGSKYNIEVHLPILLKAQKIAQGSNPHWRKGKKQSDEHIAKLSVIRRGKPYSDERRLRMEKRRNLLPDSLKIKKLKSSIKDSIFYTEWRMKIFVRDNFKCVKCGYKSHTKIKGKSDIQADHIYPFAEIFKKYQINSFIKAKNCEEMWSITNGQTLCVNCHKEKTKEYLLTGLYRSEIKFNKTGL